MNFIDCSVECAENCGECVADNAGVFVLDNLGIDKCLFKLGIRFVPSLLVNDCFVEKCVDFCDCRFNCRYLFCCDTALVSFVPTPSYY